MVSRDGPVGTPGSGSAPSQLTPSSDATDTLTERLRAALSPGLLLIREIGSGGMARVFLAREPALKRLVAVKVLSGEYAGSPEGRARFEREAQAVAGLSHPNIVAIHAVGELAGHTPYFVMQYVEGRSLAAWIEQDGQLSVGEATRALGEVAAALAAAHQQGIIHRDIKPANILFEESTGRCLVSDFGIAAVAPSAQQSSMRLTGTGMMIGTPQYMSPEQLLAEPVSEKTDIYSLGLLAHELLVGKGPFQASSPHELIAAHLRDTPARLSQLRQDVDSELDELIARCLEKDATRRPNAAEIARRLAPGAGALLEWPPPGLESLHGGLRGIASMFWSGGAIIVGAMVTAILSGPAMGSILTSVAALVLLGAVLAGVVLLLVGIRRSLRVGRLTLQAIRDGYAWLTLLEVLSDTRGDTGNVITGSREYAPLAAAERGRLRSRRMRREALLFLGGLSALPLFLVVVALGSAGYVGLGAVWIAVIGPVAAAAAAGWMEFEEMRRFARSRQRRGTTRADIAKLSPTWYETFEAVRAGQALGRGAVRLPMAGRIAAVVTAVVIVVLLVVLAPLTIITTAGASLFSAAAIPKFTTTSGKLFIAGAARPFGIPKDSTISPLVAGRAFHALVIAAGDHRQSKYAELPPPSPPLPSPPWPARLPGHLFTSARPDHVPGLPGTNRILASARRGFTVEEMAYLERIARAPQWRAMDSVARAVHMDYYGARFQVPFPANQTIFDLPIPRFQGIRELAYASTARAAYHLAAGRRDSAEAALRTVIGFGFTMADNATTLIEQLVGVVVVGIGRGALVEYYQIVGDPRGTMLKARHDSLAAVVENREALGVPDAFTNVDMRDAAAVRAATQRIAADPAAPRGIRFEMLNLLSGAPCTNLREVVFGPDADVRHTFDEARRTWARFASDSALLDMMYRSTQQLEHVLTGERERVALGPAGVLGSILRNRRLAGCTVGLTMLR